MTGITHGGIMTEIRLYNTRTRQAEPFVPLDPGNIRMYVCGPTVYDRAHLGNARPVVVFDTLFRLLRQVHGADCVTYVRNFTDVDDKINAKSAETGRPIREITDETIGWYHADVDALGALRPTHEPRATDYVGAMIAMIEGLIAKGHAYAAEGHVLFDVRSFDSYGRLSGRSVDDMIAGARVEVAPYKRDPMDFVLWKPSAPELPGWESPWGRGRPGWHIECSAMAHELLGESFDIHGGGIDLQFPHHENEVAQSCCAHPQGQFARVWMHNEMLLVEGKKMSKSLGNFFTVRDLLNRGVPGEVIRFVFLSTHYGKPMDWTESKAQEAATVLRRWRGLVAGIEPAPRPAPAVLDALGDDLNTAGAIAALHGLAAAGDLAGLLASARVMGLLEQGMGDWAEVRQQSDLLEALVQRRQEAKKARQFDVADFIRNELAQAGIELRDLPGGVVEPNTSADQAIQWSQGMTEDELERLKGADGSTDLRALIEAYQQHVARRVLERLE